jgi:hypothetical protein
MALDFNRGNRGSNTQQGGDDSWKTAAGFLNGYFTFPDGKRIKLGAFILEGNKPAKKAIHDRLMDGGEEALRGFVGKIEFEYNSAEPAPVDTKNLGF